MANEIVKVEQANSIRALFNKPSVRSEIAKALPKHLTADKLIRVAMTSIQRTPKLLDCDQKSLLACIMTCASLGLEPDQFLGQAYLVPFWNNRANPPRMEAQLIPGYRGYIALARRSGEVQSVSSQVVFENDHFDLQFGLTEKLEHRPAEGDRGEVRGAYVVFKYKDGSHSFDYMPKSEIDKVRARSKSSESGPWVTDYPEMAKKTVIKRHAKLAPLSVEFQTAVALEDRSSLGESQSDLLKMDDAVDAEFSSVKQVEDQKPPANVAPPKFQDEQQQQAAEKATRHRRTKAEMEAERKAKEQPGAWDATTEGQAQKPPAEVVEQFPAAAESKPPENGASGLKIGTGLEETDEWAVMNDLRRSNQAGYLQAKISLKMPQGPRDMAQVKQMIAELEKGMRQPGEDDK